MKEKCWCGVVHLEKSFGWSVIRFAGGNPLISNGYVVFRKLGFVVYKRDCPADEKHFAADLAPFSHATKQAAIEAGKRGEYAYYKRAPIMTHPYQVSWKEVQGSKNLSVFGPGEFSKEEALKFAVLLREEGCTRVIVLPV